MKKLDVHRNPDPRQLRQFGYISLFALPLLGWLWGGSGLVIGLLAVVGTLLAATAAVAPNVIRPVFVALTLITAPIGMVVSELILFLVYYAVLCPIGIFFRMIKRDPLQRTMDRQAKSYWQSKEAPKNASRYYRQS